MAAWWPTWASDADASSGSSPKTKSYNDDGITQPCVHQFINNHPSDDVSCIWVDCEGGEREYHRLEPGHATAQSEEQGGGRE